MSELILFLLFLSCASAAFFFGAWSREKEKRQSAEMKVRAHEELQKINDDIASGGDVYVAEQLRKYTRDL